MQTHTKKGYATEAMQSLVSYCFNHLPINEIRAYTHPDNKKSQAVAERIGMKYVGIREHPLFKINGKLFVIKK